ncbi:flavin reductase (NADPH) [Chrysoperla carnea]|uniref:flavin reductase (NADPH) n=1 Tax=Chrysoperla carnea TaxID=189513 RepID=UPI001D08955A|nr:flavin reductase (NADPH) [Chrysoperla carnea]
MNKILVFGSTGQTGMAAVDAALLQGLTVLAFVRNTSKIPDSWGSKVQTVVGDALQYDTVLNAVNQGVDGVVVALGTRNKLEATTDMSEGMKNIVKAMKAANVTTVSVCLSSFLFMDPEKVPKMFNEINADHKRMLDVVKNSGLNYIAVFPPHIADEPKSNYTIKHDASPGRVISKYDLGEFLVSSLSKPEHYGKSCGIAKVVG